MSVSYLITLYNKEEFIDGVLKVVLQEREQTGGEIIIYDDASTDRSLEVVQNCLNAAGAQQAPFVKIMRGSPNHGLNFATNRLIEAATQPYIRLVDADDILVPGSTAQLLRLSKEHKLSIVFGKMLEGWDSDPGPQLYSNIKILPDMVRATLRKTVAGPTPTLFATDVLRKACPLPEWARRTQDFPITLRLASQDVAFGYTDEIVAMAPTARVNFSLSSSLAAMYADISRVVVNDEKILSLADLRYASRRYAGRAAKYFRRRAKSRLTMSEKFTLWRWKNLSPAPTRAECLVRLIRAAELLERDKDTKVKV